MARLTTVRWDLESAEAVLPVVLEPTVPDTDQEAEVPAREADQPIILCQRDLAPATAQGQIQGMALAAVPVRAQELPTIQLHPTMAQGLPAGITIPIP